MEYAVAPDRTWQRIGDMAVVKMPVTDAVAVIGMSGRFPGAGGVEEFWRNLQNGVESISQLSVEELEVLEAAAHSASPDYVRARGIVADADQFDAAFFGMAAKEAEITDPQHRIFLECCWEAFENAGYDPLTFPKMAAVFAGSSPSTYFLQQACTTRDFIQKYTAAYQVGNYSSVAGNRADFLATRVSTMLNLRGPSLAVSCGYSTSLVAISQACQSLLSHQCDAALAGGVSITFPQKRGYLYDPKGIVSPDGHCKPFDASAQGTVFSSGAAVVLLKRLSEAIQDGDRIYAIIRGSAVNNDGSPKEDFTAPGVEGQAAVLTQAVAAAGTRPETINYIEAHGTGAPLEDPTEVAALKKLFRRSMDSRNLCSLGSVKANIGHLDVAAGAAGLIKVCLMLRDKKLPPLLHFQSPNAALDLENTPFYVTTELSEWTRGHTPRRAGVSAFGEGGTNAHVVLEEAPVSVSELTERATHLVLISAKSEAALERATHNLAEFLPGTSAGMADIAYTLQIGRHPFSHRRMAVCRDQADAIQVLSVRQPGRLLNGTAADTPPSVGFLFPGQGSQQVHMGYELYRTEARFREEMDRCTEILRPHLDLHLTDILYPLESYKGRAAQLLNQTNLAHPAIFALEYSLARLWMRWGITPAAMIGHGAGEYVAACLAGVFSLEDSLMLAAVRGRMMHELPAGEVLSVRLPAHALLSRLEGALSIAAIDGPNHCRVSGPPEAIERLAQELAGDGASCKRVATSHAFHSAMLDPIIEPYVRYVRSVKLSAPSLPYVSGVSGEWISAADATDPEYWGRQLRQPVLFSTAIQTLVRNGIRATLEVGGGDELTSLARQNIRSSGEHLILASLPGADSGGSSSGGTLETLGRLWLAGSRIDWAGVYSSERRQRVHLPTYPFERKRYWLDGTEPFAEDAGPAEVPGGTEHENTEVEPEQIEPTGEDQMTPEASLDGESKRKARIQCAVAEIFEGASGISPAGSNSATTFRAMGYDALALTKAAQGVTAKFGVKVALGQLVDQQSTLAALTEYLSLAISADQFDETFLPLPPGAAPEPVPPPAPAPGTLATILSDQLQAMTLLINRQLDVLQRAGGALSEVLPAAGPAVTAPGPTQESTGILEISPAGLLGVEPEPEPAPALRLTPAQESYLGTFVARYVSRTKKSKDLTQQYRARLADPRAAAGFRTAWKELVYPIVTQHSRGSRLWDLNGNEYIDIVNGFGPTLFGHAPDFVVNAVRSQLDRGFEIGPQSPIAGKVAAMLCEITGMERATFCNTGSEAVMAAIRVARSVTGRARIVMFSGAYHGIFDEVLARGAGSGTAPISSGIPARNLQNVTVLEYAAESSLQWIQENGAELAAVLVEPVQSRNPGLQPKEFLEQLRDVTTQCGAALIFDEGTTGFRVHSGGVQALFGIRADLATYGKVLGGGLPIGALAGSAKFMDSLDGGAWSFGDDSSPDDGITFFGGTFVRHPLALAAAEAVLDHLQEQGPELQERLNAKTGRLVAELNTCFKEAGLPSRVESFGSIFYFQFPAGEPLAPLFFYHLRANGLYILEGYPCFLTTAHTESDVKNIVEIFRHSIREMVEGGLFPPPPEKAALPDPDSPVVTQGGSSQAASSGGDSPGALNQISNVPLPGELDIPTLRNAVFAVCARRLTPACEAVVPIVDLSALEPAERAESWQQYTLEASRMPFVAGEAPLRITLLRLQRDEHVLVLSTPGDAPWAADSAGDEIVAEHERAKAEAERVEAYWLAQFRQLPAPFDLPTDRPRLTGRPFHTATCRTFVSEENAHRIECLGRNHGCTLFVTLLSGFHATLQRLAGRDVTVIGVPVAAQACGRVANVLPLLARSDTSTTVEQFLNQTKRPLVDACNHDAYSYDKLARKLDLFADESRVPLMEVQFHLEQATSGAPVEAQPVANFDLFLKVTTLPAGLIVDCDYRTDLFDESTIRRWLSHFESFLVNASADPSQCVQRVALMNAEETAAVLTGWKRASREYPNVRVIHELFEEQVAANPSAIAITMDGQRCTYGDLNSRANQLARYLRKYGVGPETPVGICMERCVDMLVGLLGILKSGGGYVPLDPDAPPERLRQLMEHAQSRFVITQLALLRHFSAPGIKGICMEADWPFIAQENEQNPPPAALPDHLFGAIYGPPTGGELNATAFTHRNVARLFAATDERFCFEPSDVWGLSSPATSASSIWEIWGCLLYGSRLVMISADAAGEPQELSRLLKEEGITVLNQSPSAFRKLVDAVPAESGLPLRLVIVSGEPNTIGNLQRWVDSATEVVYMHGATESTIYCSCKSIGTEEAGAGSANVIGQPLPDVEVYVLDRNLNPAPIGIEGELCIGGAGLARGYWRREDLTREHFLRDSYSGKPHGRFFRTGDLARLLPSGEIEYRGRLAGQQEPRENFSDPKDIELALRRNAAVLDVMVIVRDDEAGDGRLTAYVVPRDRSITVRELRDSLADSHPGLGIPPSFVLMEALPLTADGQLDRTALPVPDNRNWSGRGYTAPRTPTEKALAQIWAEVLRLERVGVDDDILDLGGNSGHVAQISSRAKAAGISVSPQQLVEYGTVARVLAEAEPAGKDSGFRLMEKAS